MMSPSPSIVDEVSNRIMQIHPGRCRRSVAVPVGKLVACSGPQETFVHETLAVYTLHVLFTVMKTRPLERGAINRKYKDLIKPVPGGSFKVGTIDRPRICIIPAIIIFLSLFTIDGIVRVTKGRQDLAFKQWSYICIPYGSYNTENPLFPDCKEFWNGTLVEP